MKKLMLVLFAFALITSACEKTEDDDGGGDDNVSSLNPTATQLGFAINYTATWCGPCGNWGAPRVHKYAEDAPKGAVMTAHASGDPMHNSALYGSLSGDRPTGGGIPSFWVGDKSSAGDGDMVALLASGNAKAGVDISFEKSGNTMTVKTKTKFFSPDAGEYYLSVLVLEDGIDGSSSSGNYSQNGVADPATYKHDFVLRASSITGNAYGELIKSNPGDGFTVEKTYTISLDASWVDTYPVAIVWKKTTSGSPSYMYINAMKKK